MLAYGDGCCLNRFDVLQAARPKWIPTYDLKTFDDGREHAAKWAAMFEENEKLTKEVAALRWFLALLFALRRACRPLSAYQGEPQMHESVADLCPRRFRASCLTSARQQFEELLVACFSHLKCAVFAVRNSAHRC